MNQRKSFDISQSRAQPRGSQSQAVLQAKETRQSVILKEELDWAECQKQFHVTPVPDHVFMSLYDNVVRDQEHMRKEGRQQRKELLLSMQRPFTFHEREQKTDRTKQETDTEKQKENSKYVGARKTIPKAVMDPTISKKIRGALHFLLP